MVVNGHREDFFRPLLADYVLVQNILDSSGLGNLRGPCRTFSFVFLGNDVIAELHAFIADINRRTGNQFFDFILTFSAKRTPELATSVVTFSTSHQDSSSARAFLMILSLKNNIGLIGDIVNQILFPRNGEQANYNSPNEIKLLLIA